MRRLPQTLNEGEITDLLSQPNKKTLTGLRDLVIIRLMLNTGLRASEVLSLRNENIDWTSGIITVRNGKGGKDRTLWINEADLDILRTWKVKSPNPAAAFLFTTLKGREISSRHLRLMIKRRAKRAGIAKDVHPHMLRHTFATGLYKDTKNNIRMVQKALGHAHLSTTMIYTHIHDEELEEAMKGLRIAN